MSDGTEDRKLSRATFDWILTGPLKAKESVTLREVESKAGVPLELLTRYLEEEIAESESCKSLPFALLLVCAYSCTAIIHEKAPVISAVEQAIIFDIEDNANFAYSNDENGHKAVFDINSIGDFWSWMSGGMLPLMLDPGDGWSEGVEGDEYPFAGIPLDWEDNDPRRGMYMEFNRLIGGIRLRKKDSFRGERDLCKKAPAVGDANAPLQPIYGLMCVGDHNYNIDPAKREGLNSAGAEHEHWFYSYKSADELQEQLLELELSEWIDRLTLRVEVMVPVYNAEYGLYSNIGVNFFFSRGGHIWKDFNPLSTFSNWYPDFTSYVVDGVFVGCLLWIIFTEVREIYWAWRKHGPLGIITVYCADKFNVIDWASCAVGSVIIGLFYANTENTSRLNSLANELGGIDPKKNEEAYVECLQRFMTMQASALGFALGFRYVLALFPLVITLRLFKAFSAQPRLAVVTKTMMSASVDLLHFMVVFCSGFGSYMIFATALMGRTVESFVNPLRAINQVFLALMGVLDWHEIAEVGRVEAMIWFWTFTLLLNLVMFNILIAIVMDAYGDVKGKTVGAEMLWEEMMQEIRNRIGVYQRRLVPLHKILSSLDEDSEMVHKAHLVKHAIKPAHGETNFLRVSNLDKSGGTKREIRWEYCLTKEDDIVGLPPTVLGTESSSAQGIVAVWNGIDVELVKEGDTEEMELKLNSDGRFRFYYDRSKVARQPSVLKDVVLKMVENEKLTSDLVTSKDLLKVLPDMKRHQAKTVCRNTIEDYYVQNHTEVGLEDLRTESHHLDHRTEKLYRAVLGESGKHTTKSTDHSFRTIGKELEMIKTAVDGSLRRLALDRRKTWQPNKVKKVAVVDGTVATKTLEDHELEQAIDPTHLAIGNEIRLLSDPRRIVSACHDAQLSPDKRNIEMRRRSAGLTGTIERIDHHDETACVTVFGVGKLWFSLTSISEIPPGTTTRGPPTEAELERRRAEEEKQQKDSERAHKLAETRSRNRRLEAHMRKLELQQEDLKATNDETNRAVSELRQRLDRRQSAKAHDDAALATLEERRKKLAKAKRGADSTAQQRWSQLHGADQSRNEYFDAVRRLVAENQVLRSQLDEEEGDLEEAATLRADWREGSLQDLEDLQAEIGRVWAEHTRHEGEELKDLAWMSGRADAVSKMLTQSGRAPIVAEELQRLRDATLVVWHKLQDFEAATLAGLRAGTGMSVAERK